MLVHSVRRQGKDKYLKVSPLSKAQPRCDGPSVGASFAVKVHRAPVSGWRAWDVIGINCCFASAMNQDRLRSLQPLFQKAMVFSDDFLTFSDLNNTEIHKDKRCCQVPPAAATPLLLFASVAARASLEVSHVFASF